MTERDSAKPPVPVAPKPAGDSRDWRTYRRLLGYVADQKTYFLLAVVGFLAAAACEAGFATILGVIVDTFEGNAGATASDDRFAPLVYWALEFAWAIPVAMLGLALIRGLGSIAGEYLLSRVSFRAIHVIRCSLFDRLLAMPSAFYDRSAQGHLVSRLTFTAAQLRDSVTDALKIIVQDGLKIIVLMAAMLYLNWMLTLIFLVIAPVVGTIVRYASRRFRRISKRIQDSMGDVTHVASEAVAAYRDVKVYGGEGYERRRFTSASDTNRRQNLKMTATKATSAQFIQLLAAAGLATLVGLLLRPEVAGTMSSGEVIAYLGLAGLLANPVKRLSDVNARLQRGLAAAVDIFAQLDQDTEEDAGSLDVERVEGAIRFEEVFFGYQKDKPVVVSDVSFEVQPGQTVALVGRSGSGKSTLASLIARFYEPTSGRVLLDGEPLGRYRLACLRQQIALVPQQVTLFNDTLANNIAYGGLAQASREVIDTAVRRAHADVFIDRMPDGLDTVVGDDGVLLSGGERQRIAIARALLKDAPILILDEATSSLDAHAERHIQAALEEVMRDRTTLVIAHRLSTVEKADLILVVDDGRIIERGDHAALIAANGAYANLYRSHLDDNGAVQTAAPRHPVVPAAPRSTFGWLEPLVRAWYGGRFWPRLLWPVSMLYAWIAKRRRQRFTTGKARAWKAPVPVIVVGNVTTGGTGKTPLVIWLVAWLRQRGVRAGVVSRGYGGRASYPLAVTESTPASACGDEAAMIARRADCPVVVDPNRSRATRTLLADNDIDVVISDDGLQHYALRRDVEIAVVDGARGLGNGLCLPAGPLREPASRLRECDWIVANGEPTRDAPAASTMVARATGFVNLATGERLDPDTFVKGKGNNVLAVAGVGNPERFRSTLAEVGLAPVMRTFPDHHRFAAADLAAGEGAAVVVTEKDAEKIKHLGEVGDHCWYLEIEMDFCEPVDELLLGLLRRHGVAIRRPATAPVEP